MTGPTNYPPPPPTAPPPPPSAPPSAVKKRRLWPWIVIGVVAVIVIGGSIAGGKKSDTTTTASAPAATTAEATTPEPTTEPTPAPTSAPPPAAPAAATTSPMGFLRPTPEQAAVQAAAFLAIDSRMDETDRYLTRSVDMCGDIRTKGYTGDVLVAKVQERFEGGSMPDLSDQQAQQIIDAIMVWCTPV